MIISNCWARNSNAHQLPVRKQNLCCLPEQLSLESILLFLSLRMKCLSSRVYFNSHLYTCIDIHTKPELCLLSDVVLWPVVLFFHWRQTNDTEFKTFKPSAHGLQTNVSQHAPVFARCIPEVCNLQEIYYRTYIRIHYPDNKLSSVITHGIFFWHFALSTLRSDVCPPEQNLSQCQTPVKNHGVLWVVSSRENFINFVKRSVW